MREAMLLRNGCTNGHFDLDFARIDTRECRAKRGHKSLLVEAFANALLKVSIDWLTPHAS
jgi:hypothetical protein